MRLVKKNEVNMSNVFYAKDINTNLISFGKLTDNNTIISNYYYYNYKLKLFQRVILQRS